MMLEKDKAAGVFTYIHTHIHTYIPGLVTSASKTALVVTKVAMKSAKVEKSFMPWSCSLCFLFELDAVVGLVVRERA